MCKVLAKQFQTPRSLQYSTLFAIIIVFGGLLNGIVVAAFWEYHKTFPTKSKNIFSFRLSVGDLLLSLLAAPLAYAATISRKWRTGQTGCTLVCRLSFYIMASGCSVERYKTLTQLPTLSCRTDRTRALILVVVGCFAVAFVTSCFPLMDSSKYTFEGYVQRITLLTTVSSRSLLHYTNNCHCGVLPQNLFRSQSDVCKRR